MGARGLLWAALLAALSLVALAGCFNPEYGAGGFSCFKESCPAGYGCVNAPGGKRVCKQGAKDEPPGDAGADGPVMTEITCLPEAPMNHKVSKAPGTFDLVLDSKGNPYPVIVDPNGDIRVLYWDSNLKRWQISATNAETAGHVVAAAVHGDDTLYVLYPFDSNHPTVNAMRLDGSYAWQGKAELDSTLESGSLDLAAHMNKDSPLYFAATGTIGTTSSAMVGRFDPGKAKATPVCTLSGDDMDQPRVAMVMSGPGHFAASSVFDHRAVIADRGWELHHYNEHTSSCPVATKVAQKNKIAPAAVAVDSKGQVRLAYSSVIAGDSPQSGDLTYASWDGRVTTPPSDQQVRASADAVDSRSVDLALDSRDRACISYFARHGLRMELYLSCQVSDEPKNPVWKHSKSLLGGQGILTTDYKARLKGGEWGGTRLRVSKDAVPKAHVVYVDPTVGGLVLRHRVCLIPTS